MNSKFCHIRFVLVETSHPGNIGATARAMKCMGLQHLTLVNPALFPCQEATAMASGADDLLVNAQVCETLEEAIKDCALVVATSARLRSIPWPVWNPEQCAEHMLAVAEQKPVALIFGREHSGLTNSELEHCQAMVKIPTVENFSALNISQAAQIMAYSLLNHGQAMSCHPIVVPREKGVDLASNDQLELLYQHIEKTLIDIEFLDPQKPRRLMRRIRRMFNRISLDTNEYNILRGIMTEINNISNKLTKEPR